MKRKLVTCENASHTQEETAQTQTSLMSNRQRSSQCLFSDLCDVGPGKVELCGESLECRLHECVRHDICHPSHQVAPEQVHAGCRVQHRTSRAALEYLCTARATLALSLQFTPHTTPAKQL